MSTRRSRVLGGVSIGVLAASAGAAFAGPTRERAVIGGPVSVLRVTPHGTAAPGAIDGCSEFSTYSSYTFENPPMTPQVTIQAGFAEGETAAASYTLPAEAFPVKVRSVEMLFSTLATVPTTTAWSVRIWRGTPGQGAPIAEFSSDGELLSHIEMPPIGPKGSPAVLVQFQIDPQDPEQIIITDNGTHTFSVGFRIDEHNNGPSNPCSPPSVTSNAFPCNDQLGTGVNSFGNWGCWITCLGGCPGGCKTFAALGPGLCAPSTDWILRAQWEPNSCSSGCYPDCNANQQLDVSDFGCFQTRFVMSDPYADCNQDGQIAVSDFGCFQTKFVLGCP